MLKTEANPDGVPIEAFDADPRRAARPTARNSTATWPSRSSAPTAPARPVSQGIKDDFWRAVDEMRAEDARIECVDGLLGNRSQPRTSPKIDVPTLIVHGDDDQIVPIANSALKTATMHRRMRRSRSIPARRTACRRPARSRTQCRIAGLHHRESTRQPAVTAIRMPKIEMTLAPIALIDARRMTDGAGAAMLWPCPPRAST